MTLPPSESSTRLHVIDQQLERAGWSVRRGNLQAGRTRIVTALQDFTPHPA